MLGAGGKVLNIVDLSDVYMTFFLPTAAAGRVAIGSEVHLVLDAAPQYVVPARVTFVADVAQFTPKTVETAEERQKLMFRIKAKIPPDLLKKYIRQVKTGLPGMAYVRLDPERALAGEAAGQAAAMTDCRGAARRQAARRRAAIRQGAGARRRQPRPAGGLHGRADRSGRGRQVEPAGADRRRARDQAGQVEVLGGDMASAATAAPSARASPTCRRGSARTSIRPCRSRRTSTSSRRLFGQGRAERERRIAELVESTGLAPSSTGRPASCRAA